MRLLEDTEDFIRECLANLPDPGEIQDHRSELLEPENQPLCLRPGHELFPLVLTEFHRHDGLRERVFLGSGKLIKDFFCRAFAVVQRAHYPSLRHPGNRQRFLPVQTSKKSGSESRKSGKYWTLFDNTLQRYSVTGS